MNTVKSFIRADEGRLSRVVEYGTGTRVEFPINNDGSLKWYEDKPKQESR